MLASLIPCSDKVSYRMLPPAYCTFRLPHARTAVDANHTCCRERFSVRVVDESMWYMDCCSRQAVFWSLWNGQTADRPRKSTLMWLDATLVRFVDSTLHTK